ncbi:MAG: cytochrome c biogenesis protein ResB, partial [Bacteroidota bacterium]
MKPLLRSLSSRLMPLFNTKASGIYLLLFAAAIGVATFIENDFGTSAAQKVIFKSWWFELLLALFAIAVMVNIRKFRMIQQKKWALLMFHSAIVVILIGAGVTRYASFEGMMHIREEATSNEFLSSETYLTFQANQGSQSYEFAEPVLFASLGRNHFEETYQLGKDVVEVKLKQFIPNPTTVLVEHPNGRPILKLVVAGANGREEYFLGEGDSKQLRGGALQFSPANPLSSAVQLRYQNDQLQIASPRPLSFMVMATQEKDTLLPTDGFQPLRLRALYSDGQQNFVFADFHPQSRVKVVASDLKVRRESQAALNLEVAINGQPQDLFIYGQKGIQGRPGKVLAGDLHLEVAYGSKVRELPFALKLYDFQLETYPGTNSAASYASEVQLLDPRQGIQQDFRIYMNHILNYDGYRFFQSSYDRDEKGTYLSVNHDFWGTWISYVGYGLLTLGMIWTFFSSRTRFSQVRKQLQKLREKRAALTLLLLLTSGITLQAKEISADEVRKQSVSQEHADAFSQLVVQDFKGRMKPIHTLSREVLRKVSRQESWYGLSADQILLSLFANSREWHRVPLVKLGKHPDLFPMLGLSPNQKRAAYIDFFAQDGSYKLRDAVRAAHNRAQADRGKLDKELLKIDERVNILRMAFTGSLLSVVPNPSDPNNQWLSAQSDHQHQAESESDQYFHIAQNFFQAYHAALQTGIAEGSYAQADQLLTELAGFQTQQGGEIMPSATKIQSE